MKAASLMKKATRVSRWFEENKVLEAIRQGMVFAIPVFLLGSLSLLLLNLPIDGYSECIRGLFGGSVYALLTCLHTASFEYMSLVLLLTISYHYGRLLDCPHEVLIPVVALGSFIAYAGGSLENGIFDSDWLFTSIVISLLSTRLFSRLTKVFTGRKMHTDGADARFNMVVASLLPMAIVLVLFALVRILLVAWIGTVNFQNMFAGFMNGIFQDMGRNVWSGLLYMLMLHVMWFFGIHGGNVMNYVGTNLFGAGGEINAALAAAGQAPTEIWTKTFFDNLVLMGGCGSLLCLAVAILLVGRRRNVRTLTKIAALPLAFNINELLMFGIPVVLNPILLIPFILTPLALTLVSAGAMAFGLVPLAAHPVTWTAPLFWSGYVATGSLAGSLLQLVNLAVGVAIYIPFVKWSQRRYLQSVEESIKRLTHIVQDCEQQGIAPSLLSLKGRVGSVAKMLATDLRYAMKNQELDLYYQPQVRADGTVLGAEALLRWKHDIGGFLYPPLVIALAQEDNTLDELGAYILRRTCRDIQTLEQQLAVPLKISANLSVHQFSSGNLPLVVKKLLEEYNLNSATLCLEVTEQAALSSAPIMKERIDALRALGIQLAVDDFGMGHSSLMYLQNHDFDIVKLDGALVRDLDSNAKSGDIISSIIYLSRSLGFQVIAEYVETESQRAALEALGCVQYQGYLYSPALPFEDFLLYIQQKTAAAPADESAETT